MGKFTSTLTIKYEVKLIQAINFKDNQKKTFFTSLLCVEFP